MSAAPHYFIGIPIPDEIAHEMYKWQDIIRPYVSYKTWTNESDFHITIKFLGAVSSNQLNLVKLHCSEINKLQRERIKISGVNFFGKSDHPRVMYAEVAQNSMLEMLKKEVENRMDRIGFPKETRSYRPHITLSKKWSEGKLKLSETEINQLQGINEMEFQPSEFHLYRIEPNETPKYKIVESYQI